MKVIIIGGVAGGASAAARLRRLNETAEIIMIERSGYVSYANCGLPYYVGGTIIDKDELTLQTPESFWNRFHIEARVKQEVVSIDTSAKKVKVLNLTTKTEYEESYDKLILTPGAKAIYPPLPGIESEGIFTLRTVEDSYKLRDFIDTKKPKNAVIVGAGFIGLEMAENLMDAGIMPSIIEKAPQVMAPLDYDMACLVHGYLKKKGISLRLGTGVTAFEKKSSTLSVTLDNGELLDTDMVILAIGVTPDTYLAANCGLKLGRKNSIQVNEYMQTSDPDIYAAGDAVEITNTVTGEKALIALAGPANKEGRVIADNICGLSTKFAGAQGSSVLKLFELTVAATGINERSAKASGIPCEAVVTTSTSHASYYPGAENMTVKTLYNTSTGKILGAQIIGMSGVDKRIDVLATAIKAKMSATDLQELDLAYAPPYSSAKDPVNMAGFIINNIQSGRIKQYHWDQVEAIKAYTDAVLLDVRTDEEYDAGHIEGAINIPVNSLRDNINQLDITKSIYINCHSGLRSYIACSILQQKGYTCYNLSGGYSFYSMVISDEELNTTPVAPCGLPIVSKAITTTSISNTTISADDIKKVKGLGFLHCKGTDNFNGRVITRNGKISNAESQILTTAAKLFGTGEITMTTRLTLEVQGIPYENIDAFREYIAKGGLMTGGTGSKVRPIVSCKGTTCQYGLIDTFALSDEIHKRFFIGYNDVSLPHKFKIAVGGCPNNCVKPNLNDLGIIGQRIPVIDNDLCRGCKVCSVEAACPINSAKVIDGKLSFGDTCNHCGRCIGKCNFNAVTSEGSGYKIYLGGRWGKNIAIGKSLDKIFTDKEEVMDIIEKTLLLFREQGISGERFSQTAERLGFDNVQAQLLSDDLLIRKDKILGLNVKGGATC